MGSLVDPSYELIDPTPDVHALFCQFDTRFFDGKLAACEVKWSPRMTTCAGICCYEGRSGLCSIKLSTPLLKLRPRKDLIETLLHEMIHAFLFVTVRDRDRDGHGPQFQWHMQRINKEAGTHITIYHSFHAEVAVYKNHHWRCSGPCRERRPFFGWVKRASNRAPSKNDLWWAEHERTCGGKYTKVSEPKEYTEKKEKAEKKAEMKKVEGGAVEKKKGGVTKKVGGVSSSKVPDDDAKQPRIDSVFGGGGGTKLGTADVAAVKIVTAGGGQTLGGGGAGRSRLLDLFEGGGARTTVVKQGSTVETKKFRLGDEIMVIEVPRERPRLRGGSNASLTGGIKDGDAADEPMDDSDSNDYSDEFNDYGNDFHVGGEANEFDEVDSLFDPQMPMLTAEEQPGEPQSLSIEKRRWRISTYEQALIKIQVKIQNHFEAGEDDNAMKLMEDLDVMKKILEDEKNELAAWEFQEEEKRAKKEDDERIMRKVMGESSVPVEGGTPHSIRTNMYAENSYMPIYRWEESCTPVKTDRNLKRCDGKMEEKERDDMKEEEEDEVRVTKRKRRRSIIEKDESRVYSGDEAEPMEEEDEMEEYFLVRRIPQVLDMTFEQFMMLPKGGMPRAEPPVYQILKTKRPLYRKKPVVPKEFQKKAEEWRKAHPDPPPCTILGWESDEEDEKCAARATAIVAVASDSKQDQLETMVAAAAAAAGNGSSVVSAADAAATTLDQPPIDVKKRTGKLACGRKPVVVETAEEEATAAAAATVEMVSLATTVAMLQEQVVHATIAVKKEKSVNPSSVEGEDWAPSQLSAATAAAAARVSAQKGREEKEERKKGEGEKGGSDGGTHDLAGMLKFEMKPTQHKGTTDHSKILQGAQEKKQKEKTLKKRGPTRNMSRFEPVGEMEGGEQGLKLGSISDSVDPSVVQEKLPMMMSPSSAHDSTLNEPPVKQARE